MERCGDVDAAMESYIMCTRTAGPLIDVCVRRTVREEDRETMRAAHTTPRVHNTQYGIIDAERAWFCDIDATGEELRGFQMIMIHENGVGRASSRHSPDAASLCIWPPPQVDNSTMACTAAAENPVGLWRGSTNQTRVLLTSVIRNAHPTCVCPLRRGCFRVG